MLHFFILSEQSKYFRFMQNVESLTPLMLARFTQIDYDTEIALIAVINDGKDNAMAIGKDRGGRYHDGRGPEK